MTINLTPKAWKMQSEITTETAKVGDVISYSDACNYNRYCIIDIINGSITIQSIDDPEWIDVKDFKRLNKRWEFCLNEEGAWDA